MKPMIGMLWTWTCQITIVIITCLPVGDACLICFRQFHFVFPIWIIQLDFALWIWQMHLNIVFEISMLDFAVLWLQLFFDPSSIMVHLAKLWLVASLLPVLPAPFGDLRNLVGWTSMTRTRRRRRRTISELDGFTWSISGSFCRAIDMLDVCTLCDGLRCLKKNICVHTPSFWWTYPQIWFLHHSWLATIFGVWLFNVRWCGTSVSIDKGLPLQCTPIHCSLSRKHKVYP